MIVLALVAMAPTLAAVALPPRAAGEVILAGHEHAPIVAVASAGGQAPPGVYDYVLVEQAVITAEGCRRRSWQVSFRAAAGDPRERAMLDTIRADEQVALRTASSCGAFATAANGIDPMRTLDALRFLERAAHRRVRVRYTCTDATASGLCRNDDTICRALTVSAAWAVVPSGSAVELWLGTRGGTVTIVRYDPTRPDRVSISRAVPAPF